MKGWSREGVRTARCAWALPLMKDPNQRPPQGEKLVRIFCLQYP